MARASPSNCKANLTMRRGRFTVPASCGSRRAETNSCNRRSPRCSARINNAIRIGIKSNPQSHCGAPKVMGLLKRSRVEASKPYQSARPPVLTPKRIREQAIQRLNASTPLLRQFLPDRLRQQNLREQQTAAAHEAQRKQITVLLIFLHAHGRFLQLVDIVINFLERLGIGCPEEFAVSNLRNL